MEKSLFGHKSVKVSVENVKDMNIFDKEMFKEAHSTLSGNCAIKYSTSGNPFLDDFASISCYRQPRELEDIYTTMNTLWGIDKIGCLKNMVYLRLITRDVKMEDGTILKAQRGQGLKYEYIHRLLWLATYHMDTFKKNISVFVSCGSWNDLCELLRDDLITSGAYVKKNNELFDFVTTYIISGVLNPNTKDLVLKYLPTIKRKSECKTIRNEANTIIGKAIANKLFPNVSAKESRYKRYRQLKSSGAAHEWQKAISQGRFDDIDFNRVSGRALAEMANTKFLDNHKLVDKFIKWMESKDTVKFVGYPYELMSALKSNNRVSNITANKQFMQLVNTSAENMVSGDTKFITCVDSSGSMSSMANGTNVSALDVAQSMALFFSYTLEGDFSRSFLEFNSNVTMKSFGNGTPSERIKNARFSGYCGSTDFLKVARCLVDLKNKGYKESEFPTGVLCVSDGEFDRGSNTSTTFERFLEILRDGGFSNEFVDNFKLVLWDIPNDYYGGRTKAKFESLSDRGNFFYMSGFDPSGIAFLTGIVGKDGKVTSAPKNAEELYEIAMSQDILNLLVA